jgi:hypothetical protein
LFFWISPDLASGRRLGKDQFHHPVRNLLVPQSVGGAPQHRAHFL